MIFYDEGSIYINNHAVNDGGIFLLVKSKAIVVNSTFFEIGSNLTGGVISLREASEASLENCVLSKIYSKTGGLANVDTNSKFTAKKIFLQNCQAFFGSIVFLSNGLSSNCTFEDSYFFNITGYESSLLFLQNSLLVIINCWFNMVSELIQIFDTYLLIKNVTIEHSRCFTFLKGCIFTFFDESIANITNLYIIDMISNAIGGVIYCYMSDLYLVNASISQLNSSSDGSFLYSDFSFGDIKNAKFYDFQYDLIFLKKSSLKITNCSFDNYLYGGYLMNSLIFCYFCKSLYVEKSSFSYIYSKFNGSCISINGILNSYSIVSSSFFNNSSNDTGGAIFHMNSQGNIENSVFINNKAQNGGAMAFFCTFSCPITLKNNIIQNNYANIEGGAIKWFDFQPIRSINNIFINNYANLYGSDVANTPIRFGVNIYSNFSSKMIELDFFLNNSEFQNGIILYGQKTGDIISNKLQFFLLDYDRKMYKTKNQIVMKVDLITETRNLKTNQWLKDLLENNNFDPDKSSSYIYGTLTIAIDENFSFIFDKINIVGSPNSIIFLNFSTSSINYPVSDLISKIIIFYSFFFFYKP